ncbi:hypothetical protein CONLIGDRAFT_182658 [Coniochaeta ligniaria NRRL 30616]|uniref:Uncharacterized protein n=1 Tax=Coniochaeta ligniaria NRRL 30616 TaxID=1408157 RepID=A0A1J7JJJ1_9PEZI|nr:hypothetical protein CONLIGDRAFT_182658 [Coniochaeta ligniaria NRRL 30616]
MPLALKATIIVALSFILLASCRLGTLAIRSDSKAHANISAVVYQLRLLSLDSRHNVKAFLREKLRCGRRENLVEEAPCDDWLRVMDILPVRTPRGGAEVTAGGHVPSTVVDGASVSHRLPRTGPWDLELTACVTDWQSILWYYWTSRQHNCRIRAPASSVTMRPAEGASTC